LTASSTTSASRASGARAGYCRSRPGATRSPWCVGAAQGEHHRVQERGRFEVFSDYHLRVCEVTADSHPPEGLPVREQRFDETETGEAKALAITEVSPAPGAALAAPADTLPSHLGLDTRADGLTDHDMFESIYNPGKMLLLTSWKSADSATRWEPRSFAGAGAPRHRRLRCIRDYGMFDRRVSTPVEF
jgi:heme-degrading monooxygenase HmoA